MTSLQASLDGAFSAFFAAEYYALAALALVVYDWLISLDDEIRCFWASHNGRRKLRPKGGTVLYVLSRYPPIIHLALSARSDMPMSSDMACRVNFGLQTAMLVWYALTPASFSALRIYALSPQNKILPLLTFLLLFVPSMAVVVINAYVQQPILLPSPWNCSVINRSPISPWLVSPNLEIATRVCSIAGDLLVLFVTWAKTYSSYKTQRRVLVGPSLVGVMLQNGSIYFIFLTIMNAMCVIPQAIVEAALFETFATVLISPLTAILTCRFLLDLHHANRAAASGPTSLTSTLFSGSPASLSLHFAGGAESQLPEGGGGQTTTRSMRSSNNAAPLPAFIASMGEQVHMHLGSQLFVDTDLDVSEYGVPADPDGDGIELIPCSIHAGGTRVADGERWERRACGSEDRCELPAPCRLEGAVG